MKAINLTGQSPTKRQKLINLLPLTTPLVVQIFPIYCCNFRCNYCLFQIPEEKRHFISDKIKMDFSDYIKVVNDMKKFPKKIKLLRFVGIGEPLLHDELVKMIEYTKKTNIAEKIELITNGSLLSHRVSLELIKAGLDRIVISIQGTTALTYNKICGVKFSNIDFSWFIHNIKYLYRNKKQCNVYIKIIDSAIEDKNDEQRFYKLFGDICDSIGIESTVPIHNNINLKDRLTTQYGEEITETEICPQPFYHLQINPDLKIIPCQSFEYPAILGDAKRESIVDIWNNANFTQFRKDHVLGVKNKVCSDCNMKKYRSHKSDFLDKKEMEKKYI